MSLFEAGWTQVFGINYSAHYPSDSEEPKTSKGLKAWTLRTQGLHVLPRTLGCKEQKPTKSLFHYPRAVPQRIVT